jgi:SSS family solute:Na+ symporter
MTFVMPLLAMYALALAPDVFTITGGEVPPAGAFGVLAGGLPLAIGVLVPIGFVAASVSTYTTDVVAGAALGLRDFYQRFFAPEAEPEDLVLPSRIISVIVLIIAFLLTIVLDVQGLVELFLATLGIASVIVLVDLHWKVMTARSTAVAVVIGIITVFGWTLGGVNQMTGIHVVWPTLGLTLGIGILGGFVTEQKYYMQNDWSVVPTAEEVDAANDINLTEDHLAVLESIATGGKRFADILDTLQIASHQVNEIVEELDRNRYIHREGKRSHQFYKFELTEKGRESLEEADIGADEEALREHDLNEDLYETLKLINEQSGLIIDDIAEERDMLTSDVVPLVQRLLEQGYISGYGQIRQKLETTEQGETVLRTVDLSDSATNEAE